MRLRTRLLTAAVAVGALVVPLAPGSPAAAAPPAELDAAVGWLLDQQQDDGGFETAGFPGFETPDAIFALAGAAQTGGSWSTSEARAAIEAAETDGEPARTPLDAVDDWVDEVQGGAASAGAKAQQAAKVVVLVAAPLGLDATDFDPSDDTEGEVDLVAALLAAEDGGAWTGVPLGSLAYVAWALAAVGEDLPASLLTAIEDAQHPDGGFDFTGDPDEAGFDVDITASVVIALALAGEAPDVVDAAVVGLSREQRWTGEWAALFDDGNPNSTAVVVLMARALGATATGTCWYGGVEPRLIGVPYPSPIRAITRRALPDGRIASPSDDFGVNTFATSQAIQALAAVEGPVLYTADVSCGQPIVGAHERVAQAYYVDLLDRVTEPGGAAYWATQFQGGMSPALLAKRFVGTREYSLVVAERLVRELFDREPTPTEVESVALDIRAGWRLHARVGLLSRAEYVQGAGSAEGWAAKVFADAVGRVATPGDIDFVLDQLDSGRQHADIARFLVFSNEGRRYFVRTTYHDLLRREPAGPDLTYWAGELARGVSPERLVTLIIGSAEYRGLAANA